MDPDYPAHLLAREPPPPYAGEGAAPLVWAVDSRPAPSFWFPRDCRRGCIWPVSTTTAEDRERLFGQSDSQRVHVVEADWLERVRCCRLYAYRLPIDAFRPHEVGSYWIANEKVEATGRVVVDDLLGLQARARIELRITPSIWPFWRRVAGGGGGARPSSSAAPDCPI